MKVEPGNKGPTQLSPTVQAAEVTKKPGGKKLNIDLFYEKKEGINVVADALQTEQGVRFYRKKNRNTIRIGEKIPDCMKDDKSLIWLTLEEIKYFIKKDALVNMDLRSVISMIPYTWYEKKNVSEGKFLQ